MQPPAAPAERRTPSGLHIATPLTWRCDYEVAKYWHDLTEEDITSGRITRLEPYEVIQRTGNVLTNNGSRNLWNAITGLATVSPLLNNANANIAVSSNGGTAVTAAAADTNLAGIGTAANFATQGMVTGYPANSGTQAIQLQSLFATGSANFAWLEWGVFNGAAASTLAAGVFMLNHVGYGNTTGLGTKTSAASWTFTVTLTIS